ncbi:hypothetical protein DN752_17875 [Echinicola strongylocentroti]|uniref:Uncharacterized protein n=1 Tax=Echinicola strongylocentroti TaxID=1795355 RepID=A0A2Z4IM91_9BACT|nr:hypothetical protein [Echinicola strongylocentroti]AWW31849.1 hypothetical protein DN752_17875 [Echinicola strongylocentroti]
MSDKKNTPTPEEQITALQDQLKAETAKAEALANENNSLKESLQKAQEDLKTPDPALADKDKEIERLKAELEDSSEIVADLKSQLKLAGKKGKGTIVEIGKKKYLVKGGFVNKEGRFTPEDIAADPKLAKSLVDRGSGLLKEIK